MLERMMTRLVAAAGAVALAASCSSVDPQVYKAEKPQLDLKRYFDGPLVGHGMFMDRSGQVQRRFVVTIRASWNGDTGKLWGAKKMVEPLITGI